MKNSQRCESKTHFRSLPWYNRVSHPAAKTFFFCLILVAILGLPTFVGFEAIDFHDNARARFNKMAHRETTTEMTFPNVTVCHPRFFSRSRSRARGVSDALADYITLVHRPLAKGDGVPKVDGAAMEEELNRTLERLGLGDVLELSR